MKWTHSVVSDSLRPHGLGPTRLLSPWDFLGKSTGVGCHFLLQGIFLTQGSNPGLQHCRQMFYPLSHQGSRTSCRFYWQSKTTDSLRSLGDQAGLLNKTTAQSRKEGPNARACSSTGSTALPPTAQIPWQQAPRARCPGNSRKPWHCVLPEDQFCTQQPLAALLVPCHMPHVSTLLWQNLSHTEF